MTKPVITAYKWVPPFAQGLVRDTRARWAQAGRQARDVQHDRTRDAAGRARATQWVIAAAA